MNKRPRSFVYPENPYRIHQRLSVQKGLFLVPGNINKSFEENLNVFDQSSISRNIHKIIIKFDNVVDYKVALINLLNMNISDESLFPGIDGFSKSLKTKIPLYDRFREEKKNK